MAQIDYPMVVVPLSPEDGGGYAAYAIDLPGCMADGDTPAEALEEVQKAIAEWIAEAIRLGREVPRPGSTAERVTREKEALKNLIGELVGEPGSSTEAIRMQIQELANHLHEDEQSPLSAILVPKPRAGSMLAF